MGLSGARAAGNRNHKVDHPRPEAFNHSVSKNSRRQSRANRLGRNDLCWCESGKKYKRCHEGREREEPVKAHVAAKDFRKEYSRSECQVPASMKLECEGKIVRAHTVPRSSSLNRIARNGHVLGTATNLQRLIASEGAMTVHLQGVKKATTFKGFCTRHDREIFAPIEVDTFQSTPEQLFLLLYRAHARERYTKRAQVRHSEQHLPSADKGRPVDAQVATQTMGKEMRIGATLGAADAEHNHARYEETLLARDFSKLIGYVIEFEQPPDVMASYCTFPDFDFTGGRLQDLGDYETPMEAVSITLWSSDDRGFAVLSALPENRRPVDALLDSLALIPSDRLADALLRLVFSGCEDTVIKPDWWEGLSGDQRKYLLDRLQLAVHPFLPIPPNYLVEDDVRVANWRVKSRDRIG